jgi:hypothetical protein
MSPFIDIAASRDKRSLPTTCHEEVRAPLDDERSERCVNAASTALLRRELRLTGPPFPTRLQGDREKLPALGCSPWVEPTKRILDPDSVHV